MDAVRLIAQAEETPLTRDAVEAFATQLPEESAGDLILQALRHHDPHPATVLAFAAVARGQKLPREVLHVLVPDLDEISYLTPLVAAAEGDRITLLTELVANGRMSREREVLALFLAVELLDGSEPPPRLRRSLRLLARQPLDENQGFLLGCAVQSLDDEEICGVAGHWIQIAELGDAEGTRSEIRAQLFEPALHSLPAYESATIITGYTVHNVEPRARRNDPCPCGSGRKYKKCCGAPGAEPKRSKTAASGFRLHHLTREGFQAIDPDQFSLLRPIELAALSPEWLTMDQLLHAAIELTLRHRLNDAERFVDEVTSRSESGDVWARDCRNQLIRVALLDDDVALAERQFARCGEDDEEYESFRLRIALQGRSTNSLDLLLAQLEAALSEGDWRLAFDLSFALLDHAPALGILVGRGCLDPDHPFDSDLLLDAIGEARDRLDLGAREPWEEVYDLWALDHLESESNEIVRTAGERERHQLSEELDDLHAEMANAREESRSLDRQLRAQEAELAAAAKRHAAAATPKSESGKYALATSRERGAVDLLAAEETRRLRGKVVGLKGQIAEGIEQRRELRRQLVSIQEEREHSAPTDAPAEESAIDLEGVPVDPPRELLLPRFDAAEKSLQALPRSTATQAMMLVAKLASGDAHAWKSVKKMRAGQDVLTARVGIHYRALFRIGDGALECLKVVHRKKLDTALDQFGS